jgi:hypothetical protein
MKLRTVLVLHAVEAVALCVPGIFLQLFGMNSSAEPQLLVRFFGGPLVGVGLLSWPGREAQEPRMVLALALALFVTDIVIALVCFLGTSTGVMATPAWSVFGLYVLLAAGLEKALFAKQA